MAVITRRPRLTFCTLSAAMWVATACSLVQPVDAPGDQQARAKALADAGKHADAARLYAGLAGGTSADRDNYALLSAEQWVGAGDVAAAKRALTAVSPDARNHLAASRALVAAEIALAEGDGARAIHELDSIPVPSAPDLAQNYWYIRGEGEFLTGHPREGTRAFVEREHSLTDPAAVRASRTELFSKIRAAAEHGLPMKPEPKSDPIVAGWLQLGPVAAELQRDPLHAAAALDEWRRAHPQHPANDAVLAIASSQIAVATQFPDQIALLLPLSGRAEAVGVAVRDGFLAACLEQPAASRPRVRIYDVAADTVAGAYRHAVQDGAAFVVGPLTKEDVAAIVPLSAGRLPVLALNFLNDAVSAPQDFYQFALLPEDEARSVARRLVADGKLNGVLILPNGEWGTRIGAAFTEEISQLHGSVLAAGRYESGRSDFSDVIRQTMEIHGAKGETPTHRSDAAFIFVAGTPSAERLLMSQLKFHFAGDVPVYSTSDSFEPDPSANTDLDGLTFPDMPWMVSADPVTARIRDSVRSAWPARTARRDRLYAFGFDAYRLVPALRSNSLHGSAEIDGVTGRLRLDEHNRVRRELDWAQMRNGVPAEL